MEAAARATENLSLRVAAQALQQTALGDSFRSFESKQTRRCRTDTGNRFNHRTFELEMVGPAVRPRVKEPNNPSRAWVYRSNVTPLVPVADHAGVRQVVGGGGTAVLATDDVVDFVRETDVVVNGSGNTRNAGPRAEPPRLAVLR